MTIRRLEDRKVGIWGFGREGRAAYEILRRLFPEKPLSVIVPADSTDAARASVDDPGLEVLPDTELESILTRFEVVVKSPGISPYRPEVMTAEKRGVEVISGTRLWFEEHGQDRTLCITGTKGKSTTAALLAHLLRNLGSRVQLIGNIGTPLLQFLRPERPPEFWIIELSSYQTFDFAGAPEVAVLLNLFPEHLDWHKTAENYYRDKLKIFAHRDTATAVLNREDAMTMQHLDLVRCPRKFFNDPDALHSERGGVWDGGKRLCADAELPLPGRHNLSNLCAALTVLKALDVDLSAALEGLVSFEPLPHRQRAIDVKDGVTYVDDSISTTPQSAVAAMRSYGTRPVCIIVGGFDRGLDWSSFADFVVNENVFAVLTLPANGARIAELIRERSPHSDGLRVHNCKNLEEAVTVASRITPPGGVVLLSPGAPSFGQFQNYEERGNVFAEIVAGQPDPP